MPAAAFACPECQSPGRIFNVRKAINMSHEGLVLRRHYRCQRYAHEWTTLEYASDEVGGKKPEPSAVEKAEMRILVYRKLRNLAVKVRDGRA